MLNKKTEIMNLDPQIKVSDALKLTNNNQAELGRVLHIGKAAVNEWLSKEREYVPALQAHRLVKLYPEIFKAA